MNFLCEYLLFCDRKCVLKVLVLILSFLGEILGKCEYLFFCTNIINIFKIKSRLVELENQYNIIY